MTPLPLPAGPPQVPGAPNPPAPGVAKDGSLEPHRAGGVTKADLLAGQPAIAAGKGDAGRAVEQADELKRAAERAAAYANDRANTLAVAMDAYFLQRDRAKKGAAEATTQAADKVLGVEQFVAGQIRGSVTRQLPPLVVREFAAPRPMAPVSADDSADTVLWQPVIVLPADGKATLTFHLGAAPGGYQVVVAGHTADGRLGAVRGLILTTPPRTVEAIPPSAPPAP